MAAAADGDGEKSGCRRWMDAARYAVAAMVTVLIVVVIVNAVKVVLRPESLQLLVVGGFVSAARDPSPSTKAVMLGLDLSAQNPSERVRMYFVNIKAYLFDKNTPAWASSDPLFDSMLEFPANDMAVDQLEELKSAIRLTNVSGGSMTPPESFKILYNGGSISDVTLRLDGVLITEVTSQRNKTRPTTYCCEQLLVGGEPADDKSINGKQKVICEQRGR